MKRDEKRETFTASTGLEGQYADAKRDPKKADIYYRERLEEGRSTFVTPLTAEEEAAKAKREGRAPRIVRCPRCRRSIWVEHGCQFCDLKVKP